MSEPTPPEQPTILGNISPDEMFARAMQPVKMTSGAHGTWEPPSIKELALLFPNCEILAVLGRGGMGAVYKAKQTLLDRLVAIKLLPLEISVDNDFADRFAREARAMAKLHHPNIVSVHEFGQTSEGHLYFVMEYVEGSNLADIIHQVGLGPAQALSIVEQVCTALAYAHGKGIVHRDIKPANVMVDMEGQVKVADFGLARLTDPGAEQMGHTMTGIVMGTPEYMAPEQMKGMNVDHRADIYSLGVMVYEMLCREVPRGAFEPPSIRGECDPRIDPIVIKAMQHNPDRRYQSTTEMKVDVVAVRTPLPEAPPAPVGPGFEAARASPPPDPTAIKAMAAPAKAKSKTSHRVGITVGLAVLAGGAFVLFASKPKPAAKAPIDSAQHAGQSTNGNSSPSLPGGASLLSTSTKEMPFVNSLGMKFVPVPITGGPTGGQRVLFSIWETRVQEYERFVQDTKREWSKPPFAQSRTHPAVDMNWVDAQAFCVWLTDRERKAGRLAAGDVYRLPTDHEWSCAVGIGDREDAAKTPEEKNYQLPDIFPWGTAWPPPPGAGNYSGEEAVGHEELKVTDLVRDQQILAGYRDDFPFTAPAGSFAPNRWGVFDLGGNVWEWCEDRMKPDDGRRVLRGGSFVYADRSNLLSCVRGPKDPTLHNFNCGFRVALVPVSSATATKFAPFVNSLSMRFVPVPIDGEATPGQRVLFSVWEVRVQDYNVFVNETRREWLKPRFLQGPTHPVVNVNWSDAQAFCEWLTARERTDGRIRANEFYRLPSDHQWSCAVGIGDQEDPAKTPTEKNQQLSELFPWGSAWPPPPGAGNLSGEEAKGHEVSTEQETLVGYSDGFPTTAPVGSFAANGLGLHDVEGNVREWCGDWFDSAQNSRTLRGGSFSIGARDDLLSSSRHFSSPSTRSSDCGFRIVLLTTIQVLDESNSRGDAGSSDVK